MSIAIVHRDGWAVCDSRESMGNIIVPSTASKVSKADGFLIAHVGAGVIAKKVEKIVNQSNDVGLVEAVADMMEEVDKDGELLAVTYKRKLLHIDASGLISDLDSVDFWAIGCCEGFVLGRLLYIAESRPITIDDAEAAIKAAAVHDRGIDNRVQKYWLA